MRVLLGGATGAIGRPLIRSLKKQGQSAVRAAAYLLQLPKQISF